MFRAKNYDKLSAFNLNPRRDLRAAKLIPRPEKAAAQQQSPGSKFHSPQLRKEFSTHFSAVSQLNAAVWLVGAGNRDISVTANIRPREYKRSYENTFLARVSSFCGIVVSCWNWKTKLCGSPKDGKLRKREFLLAFGFKEMSYYYAVGAGMDLEVEWCLCIQ